MHLRRLRPTIRARLTGAATAVTMLMLGIASVAIITIQRQALTAGVDDALRQRADNLEPIVPSAHALPGEGDAEDSFAQILDDSGHIVAASPNATDTTAVLVQARDLNYSRFTAATLSRPNGHYRIHLRPVSAGQSVRVLVVGKNLDDVNDSVRILVITLAVVSPLLALLLGILAWWLTGRTLRPVEVIQHEVQSIRGGDLHRRVPVPDTDDEIAELARTMNSMLGRVESASARQQQFVDDASHELRTPLTRMVTDLDLAIAHPDDEPALTTLRRLHEYATDLRQLLHDLLYVARISQDRVAARDEVDLDDIAIRAARELRARSTLTVDTTGVGAARVLGDRRELDRAIRNLLDNAGRHARTLVAVSTSARDGFCHVVIDDDGTGIPRAERDRIFERFIRLDEARSRTDGGAGLGLAIVSDIATRHRGQVTVDDAPTGGARFILAIPTGDS
jgi:signal transduction histidine kinase